jgi:hypothetical protein
MPTVELTTFFVILHVPQGQTVAAMRKVLNQKGFQERLHKVIEKLMKQYPALKPLTLSVSQ